MIMFKDMGFWVSIMSLLGARKAHVVCVVDSVLLSIWFLYIFIFSMYAPVSELFAFESFQQALSIGISLNSDLHNLTPMRQTFCIFLHHNHLPTTARFRMCSQVWCGTLGNLGKPGPNHSPGRSHKLLSTSGNSNCHGFGAQRAQRAQLSWANARVQLAAWRPDPRQTLCGLLPQLS